MSQMLARLGRRLEIATTALEQQELGARLAIGLARVGRFAEAEKHILSMRSSKGVAQGSAGTLWVMLAEGIMQLYESIGFGAIDRISRAHALGMALGYRPVAGLASAWKAHIEFEESNFQAMATSLKLAMENELDADLDAKTRVAIVLANAFSYSGDFFHANKWFQIGHEAAVINGDQASIEALQYNRAAFRLAWLRAKRCVGSITQEELRAVRTEMGSAKGLQQLLRVEAYVNHLHLSDARLLVLEGNFEDAVLALQRIKPLHPFAKNNFSEQLIDVEIAYCLASAGELEAALALYRPLSEASLDSLDADDRLVALWMQHRMSEIDNRFPYAELAYGVEELVTELDASRAQLRDVLKGFEI